MRMLNVDGTQNLMIQRMPTKAQAVKKSTLLGKKQEFGAKYQKILNKLGDLDTLYDGTQIGGTVKGVTTTFKAILSELTQLETLINAYLEGQSNKGITQHKSKTRTKYAQNLLGEIAQERRIIARTMLDLATNNLAQQVMVAIQDYTPRQFIQSNSDFGSIGTLTNADAQRGEDGQIKKIGGGTNELTMMNQGFFKENINDIDPSLQYADSMGEQNLWYVSIDAGIHDGTQGTKDARMANRDVAMSRLDQLLGANVIAKSESFIYKMAGNNEVKGVLSADAGANGGMEAGKYGQEGGFVANQQDAVNGKTHINDPGLQRYLSRLQLIDNIAFQVDRQNSNYYLKFNPAGQVIGITGIDNDMAMGTKTDLEDTDAKQNS